MQYSSENWNKKATAGKNVTADILRRDELRLEIYLWTEVRLLLLLNENV